MKNILLLHGALGSQDQLMDLSQALTSEGFRVYTMNFSGHGGRPFQRDFGIDTFVADVRDFLKENGIDDIHVFGYSMGGYVAMRLAHLYPGSIKKIVTLGTKFDWSPVSSEKEIKKLNPAKIEEKIPAFARTLESRHFPNDWKEVLKRTADMMISLGEQPLLTAATLNSITNRTLVLVGDQDDMVDHMFSHDVTNIISNGEFRILSNTPHPIEKVNIELLSRTITDFINDLK